MSTKASPFLLSNQFVSFLPHPRATVDLREESLAETTGEVPVAV